MYHSIRFAHLARHGNPFHRLLWTARCEEMSVERQLRRSLAFHEAFSDSDRRVRATQARALVAVFAVRFEDLFVAQKAARIGSVHR